MKKTVRAANRVVHVHSSTKIFPQDVPNHELSLDVLIGQAATNEDDWNGARLLAYLSGDMVAGTGSTKGYASHQHASGEETHFVLEGQQNTTVENGVSKSLLQGKFHWVSGTGKFKNIKGGGDFKVVSVGDEYESSWEAEVEY